MNKRVIPVLVLTGALVLVFGAAVLSDEWHSDLNSGVPYEETPWGIDPADPESSISYQLFENFGPLMLILALLLFGAIIGGVYISKEEEDEK